MEQLILRLQLRNSWDSDLFLLSQKSSFSNKAQEERKNLKDTLFKINKEVGIYYHNNLMEELKTKSSRVREYIEKRKFDLNTIKKFGIGYATGRILSEFHLKSHLECC